MKSGERIPVDVDSLGREGEGLAISAESEIHVLGAFPGERALVQLEHVGRPRPPSPRRAYGRVVEWLTPAPERVAPPCAEHEGKGGRCTGCPWMVLDVERQRQEKRRMLRDHHGLVVDEVRSGPSALGYRWSSKRVARSYGGRMHLGSFRRDSHQFADMAGCLVDHPDVAAAAIAVADAATRLGIEAWDERQNAGDLRYVWLKTNGRGDVFVTLVTASSRTRAHELADALDGMTGIAWSVQGTPGNAMRGAEATLLRGRATIDVELAGRRVEVGPLGFLQPNPLVAELAYHDLCANPPGGLAFDLYAGAGITTALLTVGSDAVMACEAYAESAAGLGARPETAEAFLQRTFDEGLAPRLVVANPPRSGLGDAVCDALVGFAARGLLELRLMSCGPAALRRDLDRLASAFTLVELRAYDTLPHTPHVELVAKLHATRRSE